MTLQRMLKETKPIVVNPGMTFGQFYVRMLTQPGMTEKKARALFTPENVDRIIEKEKQESLKYGLRYELPPHELGGGWEDHPILPNINRFVCSCGWKTAYSKSTSRQASGAILAAASRHMKAGNMGATTNPEDEPLSERDAFREILKKTSRELWMFEGAFRSRSYAEEVSQLALQSNRATIMARDPAMGTWCVWSKPASKVKIMGNHEDNPRQGYVVAPDDIIGRAFRSGLLSMTEAYSAKVKDAAQTVADELASSWPEGEGFGSSDMTYTIQNMLRYAGLPADFNEKGFLVRTDTAMFDRRKTVANPECAECERLWVAWRTADRSASPFTIDALRTFDAHRATHRNAVANPRTPYFAEYLGEGRYSLGGSPPMTEIEAWRYLGESGFTGQAVGLVLEGARERKAGRAEANPKCAECKSLADSVRYHKKRYTETVVAPGSWEDARLKQEYLNALHYAGAHRATHRG